METTVMSCLRGVLPNHLQTHQHKRQHHASKGYNNDDKNHYEIVEETHHFKWT